MTNLNKLYFDIEGTTGSHLTCDVLSLSFINTSHNDKELETKTYYVRPRKSRIYYNDCLFNIDMLCLIMLNEFMQNYLW